MKKNIFLFLFICLLAGCAEIPKPQNIPWIDHQQKLELLNDWEFSGKIALITPKERHSLNIYWSQNHNQTHLILSTFLGITVLELEQIKGATKITNNDGKILTRIEKLADHINNKHDSIHPQSYIAQIKRYADLVLGKSSFPK